ncbi:hypothetical protein EDB83DRAFT_2553239 [Lactarius deliciosus]|nr:hypothetical protein EDB83DRAFT_2553239 [Lactarius deliciosus]
MLVHGGEVAFLRTPNYRLDPTDIPRIDIGQARTDHFTLQHLKVREDYNPAEATALEIMANTSPVPPFTPFCAGLNVDALFQGTSNDNETRSQPGGTTGEQGTGRQGSNVHVWWRVNTKDITQILIFW